MTSKGRNRPLADGSAGIVHFSDETLEALDKALEILIEDTNARCAMVIDRTGCILSHIGDFHPIGKETMGATAAGLVAALNTMVATAASPEISIRLYGTEVDKVHFYLVSERLILCVLYSRRTAAGQMRTAARTFAQSLKPILERDRTSTAQRDILRSVQFIESKLDDVFKDFT